MVAWVNIEFRRWLYIYSKLEEEVEEAVGCHD
jgi:hypothetical protein